MSKTDADSLKQSPGSLVKNKLVNYALAKFHENRDQVRERLLSRAEALLTRIAPEFVPVANIYLEDGTIFCDVDGIQAGFGLLSLRFCSSRLAEDDYFQVENFMELSSFVCIYSLYDLGEALYKITETAQYALQSIKDFKTSFSKAAPGGNTH